MRQIVKTNTSNTMSSFRRPISLIERWIVCSIYSQECITTLGVLVVPDVNNVKLMMYLIVKKIAHLKGELSILEFKLTQYIPSSSVPTHKFLSSTIKYNGAANTRL